jgi:hypothetical protein
VFGRGENNGQRKPFGLTVKSSLIFGKRFTVLKTVNRFPKLYSSSLHARLISDWSNPPIVGRSKIGSTGIRHHQVTGIMSASESNHRKTVGCRNPAAGKPPAAGILQHPATAPNAGGIRPESGHGQKPAGIRSWTETGRNPA